MNTELMPEPEQPRRTIFGTIVAVVTAVLVGLRCGATILRYVSRPFPSWNRSILTEIYLCHACSCQEILRTETAGQVIGADKLALGDKAWSSMVTTHRD